jgi:hypothetical protein
MPKVRINEYISNKSCVICRIGLGNDNFSGVEVAFFLNKRGNKCLVRWINQKVRRSIEQLRPIGRINLPIPGLTPGAGPSA